jgi:Raf kinase inhibitor-like YbhB/YbcL family protein
MRTFRIGMFFIAMTALLFFGVAEGTTATTGESGHRKAEGKIAALSVPFVANAGQAGEGVAFYARTFGGTVFVTGEGEIIYSLLNREPTASAQSAGGVSRIRSSAARGFSRKRDHAVGKAVTLKETLVDGRIRGIQGEERSVIGVSHFTGNDPNHWRSSIPAYGVVSLGEVYKGIEVRLKAHGNNVEKLFFVKPGADPKKIMVHIDGADGLDVNSAGELEAMTGPGIVKFTRPVAYQEIDGKRVGVDIDYCLVTPSPITHHPSTDYGFVVGAYDPARELIIDPLLQSTYLGGSGNDTGIAMAVDPTSGSVYVTGNTDSTDFPGISGGAQPAFGGGSGDTFIVKFNPTLTRILQATYLGGNDDDGPYGLAVDSGGNVYVAGYTASANFPVTSGAAQTVNSGGYADGFITKFNPDLTSIVSSTFLGGNGDDYIMTLTFDSNGNLYAGGGTDSDNFPGTANGGQPSLKTGYDGFVTKLNASLSTIIQSTYLGGDGTSDEIRTMAVNPDTGNLYAAGFTDSTDLPGRAGAAQSTYGGNYDGFISVLNPGLTNIVRTTYLGGTATDMVNDMIIDPAGTVYVTGWTQSDDFPMTAGGAQSVRSTTDSTGFVSKIDGALTSILQSTYIGGNRDTNSARIVREPVSGHVYVAGDTSSDTFPGTTGGIQPSPAGNGDAFLSILNPALTVIIQSTYLGGSGNDQTWALSINPDARWLYVLGRMNPPPNFPGTAGGAQPLPGGGWDTFVAMMDRTLVGVATGTYTVTLALGWNFVSFPKQPPSGGNIDTLLGPIASNINVLWGYDNENQAWERWTPGGGGSNTLSVINPHRGYWFHMNSPVVLDISGWLSPIAANRHLYEGWNLFGYTGVDNANVNSVLDTIPGVWSMLWGWNEGQWFGKHPAIATLPSGLEPLTLFNIGKAYWVKAKRGKATDWVLGDSLRTYSSAFGNYGYMPSRFTCDGDDVNPPFVFENIPSGTQSLALIVDDPDAPGGTWVHWVVWNISGAATGVNENTVPAGAVQGRNDFGNNDYGGPCPPFGVHRYFFRLYALDASLSLPAGSTKAQLEAAMAGHIIGEARVIGLYE